MSVVSFVFFFFFQAEDGIRDLTVTGVQTCALPISGHARGRVVAGLRWLLAVVEVPGAGGRSAPHPFSRGAPRRLGPGDRKSTRLNSSHSQISYAVFCLKKKKKKKKK